MIRFVDIGIDEIEFDIGNNVGEFDLGNIKGELDIGINIGEVSSLVDIGTNEGVTSPLVGNVVSSRDSNFNANRTRFWGRRLCKIAVDRISEDSVDAFENADFNGESVRIVLKFGSESAPTVQL